jgi:hypothetical protein
VKVLAAFPDAEQLVIDLLTELIADHEDDVTVGLGVPTGWKPTDPAHLEVAMDGTPDQKPPIVAHPTIRIIARAATSTEAKRLAALAQGLLLAHRGGSGITGIRPLAGVLPAQDPQTRAELASVSLRVTVRSEPIASS